ncbi:HAF repeat-containing PEP-CTERM protein [Chlorogloea sp. CCALA 695]|uniref:HAF repeat-containing PEP-CTERM protein n=1 Tax=Chlorogloea sp. CCALA 695 TaxID=2107693 RepID=UPI000D076A9D|nr:HAF repeat-containing PEP-CTERM protein [Chlorogloea sp. CCALA 695]PSB34875.1 hypothetical protein C7B70_02705 [Chlorogloea sp. CCALA 695]
MFSVKKLSIATAGIAIGLGSIAPVNAASLYAITGLDFLPSDINDSAQVVGQQYLWQNGNVTNLNTLQGANNSDLFATSINNKGAIVGGGLTINESTLYQETIPDQAFISDGLTISGLPRDQICSDFCSPNTAEDINDSGTIALNYDSRVGLVQQSDGSTIEAIFTRSLSNIAINNQDQVIGTGIYSGIGIKGTTNNSGENFLIPASTEPEDPLLYLYGTTASDINDSGNIVGSSSNSLSNDVEFATLWEDPTQIGVSLGSLGGNFSKALGVNNSQQIVGDSTLSGESTQHAFLWEDGEILDLNSLVDPSVGWELTSALEINNNGDIIGVGLYNGVQRGFIATAVPEPSSVLGVLGLGLFGLSNWRKRKK